MNECRDEPCHVEDATAADRENVALPVEMLITHRDHHVLDQGPIRLDGFSSRYGLDSHQLRVILLVVEPVLDLAQQIGACFRDTRIEDDEDTVASARLPALQYVEENAVLSGEHAASEVNGILERNGDALRVEFRRR